MAFTRIDKADYNGKGVIGLPDAPQLSTNAMQEKFEEISLDVIIPKHNTLIDELESATGASNIGTTNGNVQSEIDAFDGKVAGFNGDISQLKSDMTQAQGDIATLQSGVNTNKTDIAALQSDNTTNKADIATNKANITTLQNDNTTNKANISSLQADNTTNKANITKNANDISALQTSVTTNANNIASLQSDNTTNKADIASLKSDNVTLKEKAHVHDNKSVIDALSKDSATGNLMFEGNPISGGGVSAWGDISDKPFESIGNGLEVDENGVMSATGGTVDAYTKGQTDNLLNNKVDKVDGKGLSSNDYTTEEKDKLSGIEAGANKTTVDSELSDTSTNPVQNKVITKELSKKGTYSKPTGGIPKTDFSSEVQASLDNADNVSALATEVDEIDNRVNNITRRTRRNITSDLANLPTAISEQNLEKYGYAIGDYFVGASGYYYYLADMDTNYGGYGYNLQAVVNTKHCGIVVDTKSTCQWLSEGTVTNYSSSTLHAFLTNTALPNIKSDIATLFGDWENHLLKRTEIDNAIGNWGTTWEGLKDCLICAMTEVQMYGSRIFGADGNQTGTGVKSLELFRKYRFNEIYGSTFIWLKSLASTSRACAAGAHGYATLDAFSETRLVSGLILFH